LQLRLGLHSKLGEKIAFRQPSDERNGFFMHLQRPEASRTCLACLRQPDRLRLNFFGLLGTPEK
jgi:hypothetical protein